jgi:hypothetical protein
MAPTLHPSLFFGRAITDHRLESSFNQPTTLPKEKKLSVELLQQVLKCPDTLLHKVILPAELEIPKIQ